jgi:hypothetical protein
MLLYKIIPIGIIIALLAPKQENIPERELGDVEF